MQRDLAVFAEKRQYISLSSLDHINVHRSAFQVLHCFDNTERNNSKCSEYSRCIHRIFYCSSHRIAMGEGIDTMTFKN